MAFSQALEVLRRNFGLVVVPVLMDFLSLLAVFLFLGEWIGAIPPDQFSVKFAIPTIPPSISNVTEIDFFQLDLGSGAGGWGVIDQIMGAGGLFFLMLAISFLVTNFVVGGFLGLLKGGLSGTKPTVQGFFAHGRYFWKRFILLQLLLFLVLILSLVFLIPLIAIARALGAILIALAFLAVAALLVFVEYALVEEDLEIMPAIDRSVRTVASNFGPVLLHLLGVAAINLIASFFVNTIGRFSLLPAIIIYAPMGTYGVLVLYCLFQGLTTNGSSLGEGELPYA